VRETRLAMLSSALYSGIVPLDREEATVCLLGCGWLV
jgi:hypothetical protein